MYPTTPASSAAQDAPINAPVGFMGLRPLVLLSLFVVEVVASLNSVGLSVSIIKNVLVIISDAKMRHKSIVGKPILKQN